MAHTLYRVIACEPGGFKAFPIVDGKAIMPDAKLISKEEAQEDALCIVLGDYLENVIEAEWIARGSNELRASANMAFNGARAACEAHRLEKDEARRAEIAADREKLQKDRAEYLAQRDAEAAKKKEPQTEGQPEGDPDAYRAAVIAAITGHCAAELQEQGLETGTVNLGPAELVFDGTAWFVGTTPIDEVETEKLVAIAQEAGLELPEAPSAPRPALTPEEKKAEAEAKKAEKEAKAKAAAEKKAAAEAKKKA